MALGAVTRVKGVKSQGVFHDLVLVVGDGAYGAGGSTGFLAKFQALSGREGAEILAYIPQSQPDTVSELEYDFTNEKLFARVRSTGVESAVANQSGVTYRALVISK